jgi:ABC-type branched-subunit amino acid transport system ATPase component
MSTTTEDGSGLILELGDVHTYYGSIHALKGVSLTVGEGEIVTLIGSNGAGKSTTLRSINGLNRPRKGSIVFQGRDITQAPPHDIVKMGIAQAPEGRKLFPRMSVMENLEMGAFQRSDRSGIREDMDRVFTLFPRLAERKGQKAGTMSAGDADPARGAERAHGSRGRQARLRPRDRPHRARGRCEEPPRERAGSQDLPRRRLGAYA